MAQRMQDICSRQPADDRRDTSTDIYDTRALSSIRQAGNVYTQANRLDPREIKCRSKTAHGINIHIVERHWELLLVNFVQLDRVVTTKSSCGWFAAISKTIAENNSITFARCNFHSEKKKKNSPSTILVIIGKFFFLEEIHNMKNVFIESRKTNTKIEISLAQFFSSPQTPLRNCKREKRKRKKKKGAVQY